MNQNSIPLDYANNVMYEMEKAFYDERGKGARFRMTTVGHGFYTENVIPLLKNAEIDHILKTIDTVLKEKGIVTEVSYENEERLFKIKVAGCIHRAIEEKMIANNVEPFTCIPANLIVLAIEEKMDRPVELAEIRIEGGVCNLLLILFEKRPTLD